MDERNPQAAQMADESMVRTLAAQITPAESVRGMLRVIESATLAESGEFLDWKGGRYPY